MSISGRLQGPKSELVTRLWLLTNPFLQRPVITFMALTTPTLFSFARFGQTRQAGWPRNPDPNRAQAMNA